MTSISTTTGAVSDSSSATSTSVWSQLLSKSARNKSKEKNGTLLVLGEKRCGKTALLNQFHDRVTQPIGTESQPSDTTTAALAAALGSGEYTIDYSYAGVKNVCTQNINEKDEILARMHIWQLDEPNHVALIPTTLLGNQTNSSTTPATASTPSAHSHTLSTANAATSSAATPLLDYSTLDRAVILVTFDLSEPWTVLQTVQNWLERLTPVLTASLAALPTDQAKALKLKVSKYVQAYHTTMAASATGIEASPEPLSTIAEGNEDESKLPNAPPVNPSIPTFNFGVPIVFVGLKGDSFGRHLSTRSGLDEKFDFLTRQLRKLAIEYGATLIYTSSMNMLLANRKDRTSTGGVNVDILQHYIYHRIYQFPLPITPSISSSNNEEKTNDATSPTTKSTLSFQPKVIGSADDDFGIFIPAGYDTPDLLEATAKNSISAAYSDSTPMEEVFKSAMGKKKTPSKTANAPTRVFETLVADDNTHFFRQLKAALEQGPGGGPTMLPSSNPANAANTTVPAAAARPAPLQTKVVPSPTNASLIQPQPSPTGAGGMTPDQKAAPTASAARPQATSAPLTGGATVPTTGGTSAPQASAPAVKNFFKSLLATSKPGAAGTTAKPTTAPKKEG